MIMGEEHDMTNFFYNVFFLQFRSKLKSALEL